MPNPGDRNNIKREAQFTHYKPARWQPEFDMIVIESVSGKSNAEIGRLYGYTKQHISNILSTSEAEEVRKRVRDQINRLGGDNIKERLGVIGNKVVKHIENFIQDDFNRAERNPFEFIDRAIKIGQTVGAIGSDKGGSTVIGTAIIVNNDKANDISRALSMSSSLDDVEVIKNPEELGKLKLISSNG